MGETIIFGKYVVQSLLGKGKSGVSYLVKDDDQLCIVKAMHSESVPYYTFKKPKLELELDAYNELIKHNIRIPKLLSFDMHSNYLVKEYIEGKTISELLAEGQHIEEYIYDALQWEKNLRKHNINIDYFPSNFVVGGNKLYYVDYEINPYSQEWDYINWGIYYWLNGKGFRQFLETNDSSYINQKGTGIPIKNEEMNKLRERYIKD